MHFDADMVNRSRLDLAGIDDQTEDLLSGFAKIRSAVDEESAHKQAYTLYMDFPGLASLWFFVCQRLEDRKRLLEQMEFDESKILVVNRLAFYFHHESVRNAFRKVFPSFEPDQQFDDLSMIISELHQSFASEKSLRLLEELSPWVSLQIMIDKCRFDPFWIHRIQKIWEGEANFEAIQDHWTSFQRHFLYHLTSWDVSALLKSALGAKPNISIEKEDADRVHIASDDVILYYVGDTDISEVSQNRSKKISVFTGIVLDRSLSAVSDLLNIFPSSLKLRDVALILPQDLANQSETKRLRVLAQRALIDVPGAKRFHFHFFGSEAFLKLISKSPLWSFIGSSPKKFSILDEYRNRVLEKTTRIKFIGMPQNSRKPSIAVEEMYVPQRFSLGVKDNIDEVVDLKGLFFREMVDGRYYYFDRRRCVILGGAGMGKSTLCLYLHAAACRDGASETLPLRGLKFSILITFRDYVSRLNTQPDLDILTYYREYCLRRYEMSIPEGFFEYHLLMGQCLVLFDGMDEVGSADQRQEMRDKIQGFIKAYPESHYVITSRPAGYEQSAFDLPQIKNYRLMRFEDKDIVQFIHNWYEVIEATDPQEGKLRANELEKAILANDRIKTLSETPLLLTLVTLIHRYEAVLPQDRHVLYEKCTELLLQTWNQAKDKESKGLVFTAISVAVQRKILENLAFHLMTLGKDESERVTINEEQLREFLNKEITAHHSKDNASNLVDEWLEYIKARGGLLIEIQPGLFSFLHLTFLEYLCACAVIRNQESKKALAKFVVNRIPQAA